MKTITVASSGPNGKINEQSLPVSAYGTFNGDFPLPASAAPGDYYFSVMDGGQPISTGYLYFQVADYRKPEINLSVTLDPAAAKSGQSLTGLVTAEYFFGAPVPDLPFPWRL